MDFCVVEFEDGINLVPFSWIDTTKKICYWPHVGKQSIFQKMVAAQVEPRLNDPSWSSYSIKRIMNKSGKYIIQLLIFNIKIFYTNTNFL